LPSASIGYSGSQADGAELGNALGGLEGFALEVGESVGFCVVGKGDGSTEGITLGAFDGSKVGATLVG